MCDGWVPCEGSQIEVIVSLGLVTDFLTYYSYYVFVCSLGNLWKFDSDLWPHFHIYSVFSVRTFKGKHGQLIQFTRELYHWEKTNV